MTTGIVFILILFTFQNNMNSFSNDAILVFLGLFMLSLANEFKK